MKTLFAISLLAAWTAAAGEPLTLKSRIPLPEVAGRFDHFAIDAPGRRLFVAALGDNSLEVLDLTSNKRLRSIPGLRKPAGVIFLAERNQVGVAAGDDGAFKVINGDTYQPVSSIAQLDDADNVRVDSRSGRIFVGYAAGAIAVIDARTFKHTADFKLTAHPESFQLEKSGTRIFVNVPDAKQVAVLDRDKAALITTWPMTNYRANFPMALDETHHRLFLGCRRPARLVVLNTEKGAEIGDTEISGDADDLFYDAKRDRVYLSCGEGFIDVVSSRPGEGFKRIAQIPTRPGARTSFFSPDLDRYYVAAPRKEAEPAEIQIYAP